MFIFVLERGRRVKKSFLQNYTFVHISDSVFLKIMKNCLLDSRHMSHETVIMHSSVFW
jgi:hypothetical protein